MTIFDRYQSRTKSSVIYTMPMRANWITIHTEIKARTILRLLNAWCYASAVYAVVFMSVYPSTARVPSKRHVTHRAQRL